jgi:hydroxyethylthiazole kinase
MTQWSEKVGKALAALRTDHPLVHNITNYVSMDVAANVLLAVGASPAMVHSSEEVEAFADLSAALVVNIGTLSPDWVAAMKLAARRMGDAGKPWVLDPVGVGATPYRTAISASLLALKPSVIRANASEIAALAGAQAARVKGVDSLAASGAVLGPARALAAATGAVVLVSGEVDYVTDGARTIAIAGGDALMPKVTALGCSLSATVAAFCAVVDPFDAAVSAAAVFAVAGRQAGRKAKGPASFRTAFIDALWQLTPEGLADAADVTVAGSASAP